MTQQRLHAPDGALDADGEHPVENRIVDRFNGVVADQHGVVDHTVDPADAVGGRHEGVAVGDIHHGRGDRSPTPCAAPRSAGASTSNAVTRAPACAAPMANARPRPRPAPVIRMDFPERSKVVATFPPTAFPRYTLDMLAEPHAIGGLK